MKNTFRPALAIVRGLGLSMSAVLFLASTAAGEETMSIDFEGFDESTPISDQYAYGGVQFYLVGTDQLPFIATEGAPAVAWVMGFPINGIDVAVSGVNSLTAGGNWDYGFAFGAPASQVTLALSDFGDCVDADIGTPMTASLDAYDADGLMVDSSSFTIAAFFPGPDDGNVATLSVSGTGIVRAETRGVAADCGHAIDDVTVVMESCVDSDGDGVCEADDLCQGTEATDADAGVPTEKLGPKRWAEMDGDGVFDGGKKTTTAYTLADTAGCSCGQILEELGGGRGHEKFGCTTAILKRWMSFVESEGY
ncbi:MAG TPA: hypothetical protein VMW48_02070 [Vicinamibacterales bacterium]|nr:hypothetical protein [Vicinamibacterales bacterium]